MSDERTIADYHATRESGTGCPEDDGGVHYFAFMDPYSDTRMCIDCGAPEPGSQFEETPAQVKWLDDEPVVARPGSEETP